MESIETMHEKILEKLNIIDRMITHAAEHKKNTEGLPEALSALADEYTLETSAVLSAYYMDGDLPAHTKKYRMIVTSRGIVNRINELAVRASQPFKHIFRGDMQGEEAPPKRRRKKEDAPTDYDPFIRLMLRSLDNITLSIAPAQVSSSCKCGASYEVVPEHSRKICEGCGKIKEIKGEIFRDDQCYPQENQRQKHSGYAPIKHYKVCIECLQAREKKTFDPKDLAKIKKVIVAKEYASAELNCEKMREILKHPSVNCTELNDHVPLLIKTFGGRPPPLLTIQESSILQARFSEVMKLYCDVNPSGANKPYYPFFIYQLVRELFKDNPEKLRLLSFIHLQSRDTIAKNARYYIEICKLAGHKEGFKYHPVELR
jgi:hypothetical protein